MKPLPYLLIFIFSGWSFSCSQEKVEKGVSFKLAQQRKEKIKEVKYGLHFDIPESQNETIPGKNTIRFHYEKDGPENLYLDFNVKPSHLKSVVVNKKKVDATIENEHIAIPGSLLVPGENEIEIGFIAGDLSLNRNEEYSYTLFVPDRASTCFPSFDQPDLKASFTLSLTVPKAWEAVSNQRAGVSTEGNLKEYHFEPTKPISTYQFAFAAGRFGKATDPLSGMTMYYRETDSAKVASNLEEIFKLHTQSLTWLKEYTTIPYPFSKFDFVLVPTFQYGGMEHPGSIFYREGSIILDPSASVNQRMRRASLIAHETSHMWFGNLVTMKWFNDVWLKEVFANFMAAKIVNPQFPEIDHDLRFLMAHYPSAYEIDRSAGTHPIQQKLDNLKNAGTLYGAIIYQKAPIMMRNLETMMGADNFKKGLRDYLAQYSYGNATWDDLVNSLKKFTDKDLALWNKAWIKSKGMPDIGYLASDKLTIQVTNDSTGIVWPQSFYYKLVGRTEEVKEININGPEGYSTPIDGAGIKVIPNFKGRGYGYFAANEANRDYMLASVNHMEGPTVRAAVWLNIWEYVLRGGLTPKQTLETLLEGMGTEKNPLVLEYIANRMGNLFWQFTTHEDRQLISAKIDDTLFELMALEKDMSLKRILYNCYKNTATSKEGIDNLKKLWRNEMTLGLELSEQDHIDLAYAIALRGDMESESILSEQLANIKNPDRKLAMEFVMPALSADVSVRDAFFESLKDPANRAHEPWVLTALGFLHHPLRAQQSVKYIRPGLDLLEEIQLTGDIFFPKGWVDETVGSYQSKEAADIVRQYLKENPNLSLNLKNKLLQSADPLFRAEKILSANKPQPM